jgi:hypothetical protein
MMQQAGDFGGGAPAVADEAPEPDSDEDDGPPPLEDAEPAK